MLGKAPGLSPPLSNSSGRMGRRGGEKGASPPRDGGPAPPAHRSRGGSATPAASCSLSAPRPFAFPAPLLATERSGGARPLPPPACPGLDRAWSRCREAGGTHRPPRGRGAGGETWGRGAGAPAAAGASFLPAPLCDAARSFHREWGQRRALELELRAAPTHPPRPPASLHARLRGELEPLRAGLACHSGVRRGPGLSRPPPWRCPRWAALLSASPGGEAGLWPLWRAGKGLESRSPICGSRGALCTGCTGGKRSPTGMDVLWL